jgi:hypothetical protein
MKFDAVVVKLSWWEDRHVCRTSSRLPDSTYTAAQSTWFTTILVLKSKNTSVFLLDRRSHFIFLVLFLYFICCCVPNLPWFPHLIDISYSFLEREQKCAHYTSANSGGIT